MGWSVRGTKVAATVVVVGIAAVVGSTSASSPRVATASRAPAASSAGATAALLSFLKTHGTGLAQRAPGSTPKGAGLTSEGSYNWSGYVDDNSTGNTYTLASGTWTEPAVTCPTTEDQMAVFWVGLDGWTSATVEQDGTLVWCSNGAAHYYTWWEMYPTNNIQIVGSTVAPGDKIVASVTFAAGKYTLKVTDSTTPANSFTKSETCGSGLTCSNADAEWIGETPGTARGYWPLPNFKLWKVTGAKTKSGTTTGAISAFPDDQITLVGIDGQALATPGALNSLGNSFTDTWGYSY